MLNTSLKLAHSANVSEWLSSQQLAPHPLSSRRETAQGVTPVSRWSCDGGGALPKAGPASGATPVLPVAAGTPPGKAHEAAPCCRRRRPARPLRSRSPRGCSICVCSWLGSSRSHRHSRNPQSESHRVSIQTTHECPSPSPWSLGVRVCIAGRGGLAGGFAFPASHPGC